MTGLGEPQRTPNASAEPSIRVLEPTTASPLVVRSPESGRSQEFDPSSLIALLGKPRRYESAVLITVRYPSEMETIDTSWGPAAADPRTHVVATPWVLNRDGQVENAGKDYPLLLSELARREPTQVHAPSGEILLKKPGETDFWHVPQEYAGKIHVISPESTPDKPQIAEVGKIIAFTKTGVWVTAWDERKFREITPE